MDLSPSRFHPGESAIQERLGVRDKVEAAGGRMLRDYMPEQHRSFFAQLPFIVVGSVDAAGEPWASPLTGPPRLRAESRRAQDRRTRAAASRRPAIVVARRRGVARPVGHR